MAMPKTAYRPLIHPKLKTTVPRTAIRDAVSRITNLRKSNPAAYQKLIERHADTVVRIAPQHS